MKTPNPCPFKDHGPAVVPPFVTSGKGEHWVTCAFCGANGPAAGTVLNAVKAWNAAPKRKAKPKQRLSGKGTGNK